MQRAFGAPPRGGKRPSKRARARFFTLGGETYRPPSQKRRKRPFLPDSPPWGALPPGASAGSPCMFIKKKAKKVAEARHGFQHQRQGTEPAPLYGGAAARPIWTQNKRSLKLRRLSGVFYRARTGPGYP